jgi:hypothetical protein
LQSIDGWPFHAAFCGPRSQKTKNSRSGGRSLFAAADEDYDGYSYFSDIHYATSRLAWLCVGYLLLFYTQRPGQSKQDAHHLSHSSDRSAFIGCCMFDLPPNSVLSSGVDFRQHGGQNKQQSSGSRLCVTTDWKGWHYGTRTENPIVILV